MTRTDDLVAAAAIILDGFPELGREVYDVTLRPSHDEVSVIVSGGLTEAMGRDLLQAIGAGPATLGELYGTEHVQAHLTTRLPDNDVLVSLIINVFPDGEPTP